MAIKSGQILHSGNGFVVDRIQSGGASNLNIPEEKVYELGNYETVATVRDTPDLSFDMESFDMSTEIEALITGQDPTGIVAGQAFDFDNSMPMDVISPFKSAGAFNTTKGIAIPYLTLESASYRFGVRQSSSQSFTFRGDSIFYIPGSPRYTQVNLANNTLTYSLGGTALPFNQAGETLYVLSACVKNPTTHTYKRLFRGDDYSDSSTTITLTTDWFDEGFTTLHIVWGTASSDTYSQNVHPLAAVKPAAVRGKDIQVFVQTSEATPTLVRWSGVQSFDLSRSVSLENDEELGNYYFVDQGYDTADVTGTINIKPRDNDDLFSKIAQVANVTPNEIVGPYSSVPLGIEIRVNHPDTGARLKTFLIDDARFTIPNIQGQVQQKAEVAFTWTSDSGKLKIYDGERP
jgi:hypothetical protein